MPTRRGFLTQAAAAGVLTATRKIATANELRPRPRIAHIKSVVRRDETLLRLGGTSDGFQMSWAADDRQLIATQDGIGWFAKTKGFYNSRLWAVAGDPGNVVFQDMPGYPELDRASKKRENGPDYYSFGTLVAEGRIYQYLSTSNQAKVAHWIGAKLIYSPDNGRTWCNQDGSSPVVWESWHERTKQSMVFFEESQEAFSLLGILQMGRNYEANRDGYVYVYSPNGNTDGTMNELVMFRVPKGEILHRQAYEYFAGRRADGGAKWEKSIDARAVVHTFPRGWVNWAGSYNASLVVEAWVPSVTYNVSLGLYMMASCGTGCAADGSPFGKPSYLGMWVSATPWGPWTQVHEETAWTPAGDAGARAYDVQIAPKWIAADGKSFWLVWADQKEPAQPISAVERKETEEKYRQLRSDSARAEAVAQWLHRSLPHYEFNTQRFDLILA